MLIQLSTYNTIESLIIIRACKPYSTNIALELQGNSTIFQCISPMAWLLHVIIIIIICNVCTYTILARMFHVCHYVFVCVFELSLVILLTQL